MVYEIYQWQRNKISANDAKKVVRVYFRKEKTNRNGTIWRACIIIGSELCDKVGFKVGQKMLLLVNSIDSEDWLIKMSDNPKEGHTLQTEPNSCKLVIAWSKFTPSLEEMHLRIVKHEFYEGGIKIHLERDALRSCMT